MKRKFWKIIPLAMTILVMTPGYSDYKTQNMQDQTHKVGYDQGHGVEAHQMISAYNSPARYDIEGAWDFFLAGSFIFWQPMEEYLDYAAEVRAAVPTTNLPAGHVHEISYKYKPGFKAALGMNFTYDNWSSWFEYTWLYMSESSSARDLPSGYSGNPLWMTHSVISYGYSHANAKWKLNHNVIDWVLARPGYVGTKLTISPQFGIRGKWGKQDFQPSYFLADVRSGGTWVNVKSHQSSWAIGPRAGLEGNYLFGTGFRFTAMSYFSVLYQDFKTTYKEPYYGDTSLYYHNNFDHDYALTMNPEIGLGFGWGSYFASNRFHIDLLARYDFQVFTNENRMFHLVRELDIYGGSTYFAPDQGSVGNLYLNGLTVQLKLDF